MNWFLGLNAKPTNHSHGKFEVIGAPGEYAIELTLPFDAGPDEFSLEDTGDAPSLLVQMNGAEIVRRQETVSAGESPIRLDNIDGVVVGTNEFYIQATPSDLADLKPKCARIEILRDGASVADKTLWSEPGDILQGTVRLEVSE